MLSFIRQIFIDLLLTDSLESHHSLPTAMVKWHLMSAIKTREIQRFIPAVKFILANGYHLLSLSFKSYKELLERIDQLEGGDLIKIEIERVRYRRGF